MLKAVLQNEAIPPHGFDDAFAARVQAYYAVYGAGCRFASFWYQISGGEVTALLCRVDGSMALACLDNADFEELREFIFTVGFSTLTCNEKLCARLGLSPSSASYIAEYIGGEVKTDVELLPECDMKELYALLAECGFAMGDYGSFLADYCARLNKGAARLLCAKSGNRLAASASALFVGEKSVLLGAVACSPDFRGRGYASALVSALANEFYPQKRVFVFCRNDSLIEFYKKTGFCPAGRWAITDAD